MEKAVPVAFVIVLPDGAENVPPTVDKETPVVGLLVLDKEVSMRLIFACWASSAGPLIAESVDVFVLAVTRVPVPET
jgi:hypothetical protein